MITGCIPGGGLLTLGIAFYAPDGGNAGTAPAQTPAASTPAPRLQHGGAIKLSLVQTYGQAHA
jgi:hypothetical protein